MPPTEKTKKIDSSTLNNFLWVGALIFSAIVSWLVGEGMSAIRAQSERSKLILESQNKMEQRFQLLIPPRVSGTLHERLFSENSSFLTEGERDYLRKLFEMHDQKDHDGLYRWWRSPTQKDTLLNILEILKEIRDKVVELLRRKKEKE